MEMEELIVGKSYYNVVVVGKPTRTIKRKVQINKYTIVELNPKNKKQTVMASCNGAPAAEYSKIHFRRWVAEKPVI